MEGCHREMSELLLQLTGHPNLGLEVVSVVNNIPKGPDWQYRRIFSDP